MPVVKVDIAPTESYNKAVEYGVFPDDGLFHACPVYTTEGAACCDIFSMEKVVVPARGKAIVSTGFKVAIERGFEMTIRPRSGLAFKHAVVSFTGTIDADYREEVKGLVFNNSDQDFVIEAGERICQASFNEVTVAAFNVVEDLEPADYSSRTGGFGHTGRRFMGAKDNKKQIDLPLE